MTWLQLTHEQGCRCGGFGCCHAPPAQVWLPLLGGPSLWIDIPPTSSDSIDFGRTAPSATSPAAAAAAHGNLLHPRLPYQPPGDPHGR
jgi:hypothetical protein